MAPRARESVLSNHSSRDEGDPLSLKSLKGAHTPAPVISKQAEGSVGSWEGEVWQM